MKIIQVANVAFVGAALCFGVAGLMTGDDGLLQDMRDLLGNEEE
jgi:hypothetical protein